MPRHSYRSGRTSALLLVLLASIAQARASVVVTGTRVIYPGEAREKTVQLSNRDAFPNVVQAWVDIDAPDAPPDQADAPFLVNPAVFRMAPDSGQTLRIVYTGQGLPGDRESLFHLNVLQIPPRNSSHADRNQMLLMLRNRLKLFYRPAGIQGRPEDLPGQLRFALVRRSAGWAVRVDNPSGYYARSPAPRSASASAAGACAAACWSRAAMPNGRPKPEKPCRRDACACTRC